MKRLKVILMGSGTLACPLLETLLATDRDDLAAVVTQPDRAGGRGRHDLSCALKPLAEHHGLPVLAPANASDAAVVEQLAAMEPDIIVVASFGQFLRRNVLAVPRLGTINIHPSLLPRYRGASPIQWALANGEHETGVSVLYVTPRMDAGDLLAQETFPIHPDDTFGTLEPKLAARGAILLDQVLDRMRGGRAEGIPQDESQATFARKLTKEDGQIDWSRTAAAIRNLWRGFSPWPGAFTHLPCGDILKIHGMRIEGKAGGASPGTVLDLRGEGPLVATGEGTLRLTAVQPAGKKTMTGRAFLCGCRLEPGCHFGNG